MQSRFPYDNGILFDQGEDSDQKWALRWFLLVSFLIHVGLLLLFLKNPAVRNALEEMLQPHQKPLTAAQLKKQALEKKPVFIDLLDPSKVPLADQSSAPPLPKGYSLSGKLNSPNRIERKAAPSSPEEQPSPVVHQTVPVPESAPLPVSKPHKARSSDLPGFRKVKKSQSHHQRERTARKARTEHKKLKSRHVAQTRPVPKTSPSHSKSPAQTTISKSQMRQILSQASLGTPFTRHLNLAQDLAPAYSDQSNELNRIAANLEDETYSSYIKRIQERFETIGEYPQEAQQRGITGRALVTFTINKDGTLAMAHLTQSSGSRILDEEALRIVRVAAPYIPLPKSFHKQELILTWAFIFYNGGFHVIQ
ncbi:MAG: energy transducer TonB [Leptospirales bacterium]